MDLLKKLRLRCTRISQKKNINLSPPMTPFHFFSTPSKQLRKNSLLDIKVTINTRSKAPGKISDDIRTISNFEEIIPLIFSDRFLIGLNSFALLFLN